jgi:hypothetical protein
MATASSMKMARAESDPRETLAQQTQHVLQIKGLKIGGFKKELTDVLAVRTRVNAKYFFELDDGSQMWSTFFDPPKTIDECLGNVYGSETFKIIQTLLGDRFVVIRSPPVFNKDNPEVSSVIEHDDGIEIKLSHNFIQRGDVARDFVINVNNGDEYFVLLGWDGEKWIVLGIFNFRILKIIDFLTMQLYAFINFLGRKQKEPGDTISISGTDCWRIFYALLCSIEYPENMKIPVPGLELIFDAELLTQNRHLDGCIGDASDGLSGRFWNNRPGITENGANYIEYMDPNEVERTRAAGGGPFEILLDPIIALEELRLAAESIKTISDAPSSSAAGGEEEEHTSCVRISQLQDNLIFKDKKGTLDGLSQTFEKKMTQMTQGAIEDPTKLIRLAEEVTQRQSQIQSQRSQRSQQVSKGIPHVSSSIQAASASSARSPFEFRDRNSKELDEELAAKRAAVEEKWKPKWEEAKKLDDLKRKLDQGEPEENKNKNRRKGGYDYQFDYNQWLYNDNEVPEEGTQFDQYSGGGRRPRRQRRKTKRNNKQTKRRKQKTNKRVNKRQTKRIKKRRTKKV